MKKLFVQLGLFLMLLPSLACAQTLTSMKKEEVVSTFTDKTITTIDAATLNGNIIADQFTGYISKDGTLTGKFNSKPNDAPQNDTGKWKVNDQGAMCFKWNNWDSNMEKCVSFYSLNNAILVVNSGNGFESVILKKDIKSGNNLK